MPSWDTAPHMPVHFPGGSKKGKGWGRRPGKWEDPLCCYFCNKPARHALLTAGCTSTCCHLRARERRRAGAAQRGRQLWQLVAPAEAVLQRLLAAGWNEIVFMCLFPALLGLCLCTAGIVTYLGMEAAPYHLPSKVPSRLDFNQFGFKASYNSLYLVCKLYGLGELFLLLFQPLLCRTLSTTRHLGVLLTMAQVDTSPLPLPCSTVPCSDMAAPASYPPRASLQSGDTSCQLGWLSRCSAIRGLSPAWTEG